jgi:hypothetical protein
MIIQYIEWFTEQTYQDVKAFMIPHPDLPDTYEEWRYLKRNQIADLEARGHTAEKVEVIPAEFAGYCDRMGCKFDTVALRNFVFRKGSGQET